METPSSTRRITRSQAKAAAAASSANNIPISKKFEESEKKGAKSKQKERSALIDITNDSSPIIGLAMETPSSAVTKKRVMVIGQRTPGSGEALLRCQVKTLLQKVEEEAAAADLFVMDQKPSTVHHHLHSGFVVNSPLQLLAPTPANTPHLNPSENGLPSVSPSPVEDKFIFSQMIVGKEEDESKVVTRSLLLDFSEKPDSSDCSSILTQEGDIKGAEEETESSNDVTSIWSIRAIDEDEDCVEEYEAEECDEYYEEEEEEVETYDGGLLDELCLGISKIGINGAKFAGKHTRFVYNSDDELECVDQSNGDDDDGDKAGPVPSGALLLKGLPTPKGKHLRFSEDEN